MAVFAVALWAQTSALVGVFYDDGIYVVLAKALAEGEGFHYIHLPGSPAGVHYPPLYPAALSLLWLVWPQFPANVALFQVFDAAALGTAALLIAGQVRRWQAPSVVQYVFLPAGFIAFPLLTIVGVRFSEPMFLALAAAAISVADREPPAWRDVLFAGLLAGLATLTRSVGVAVIAGVAAGLWIRGGPRKALSALAVSAVIVGPWFLWAAAHAAEVDPRIAANYGTYATEARQAGLAGILEGLDLRVLAPPARLALPATPFWLHAVLVTLLLVALVRGGTIVARRAPALVASLLAYIVVVALWPYAPDRFMWIVLPWLAALLGVGLWSATQWGHAGGIAAGLLGLVLGIGFVPRQIASLRNRGFAATAEGISMPSRLLIPSIEGGTPADAVIAAEGEALIFLYTGRQSVPNAPFTWKGRTTQPLPPETVHRYFCDSGVTHVSLSGPASEGAPIATYLATRPDSALQPLFRVTRGPALFRFQCSR